MTATNKFTITFLVSTLLMAALLMGLNYLYDPWQYFGRNDSARFENNGRSQNPGIIRNFNFEHLIAGTSVAQNFRAEIAEQYVDGNVAVLPISGGMIHEQSLTVSLALKHQKISSVVWDIHPGSYLEGAYSVKPNAFPDYLYDDDDINDIFYLFNITNTRKSIKDLLAVPLSEAGLSWKNLQYWGDKRKFGCPHMVEDYKKRGVESPEIDLEYFKDISVSEEMIIEAVKVNLVNTVKNHPEVNFKIYFPPFSRLYWSIQKNLQPEKNRAYYQVMRHAVRLLEPYSNVRLYNYTGWPGVTDDYNYYSDLVHYSPEINDKILEMLSMDQGLTDVSRIEDEISSLDRQSVSLPYMKQIDSCMRTAPGRSKIANINRNYAEHD